LIALGAVAVTILGALLDSVLSVSRPQAWPARRPLLMAVTSVERRSMSLPFVGPDRRRQVDQPSTDTDRKSA
jgi:hypothetical protein